MLCVQPGERFTVVLAVRDRVAKPGVRVVDVLETGGRPYEPMGVDHLLVPHGKLTPRFCGELAGCVGGDNPVQMGPGGHRPQNYPGCLTTFTDAMAGGYGLFNRCLGVFPELFADALHLLALPSVRPIEFFQERAFFPPFECIHDESVEVIIKLFDVGEEFVLEFVLIHITLSVFKGLFTRKYQVDRVLSLGRTTL